MERLTIPSSANFCIAIICDPVISQWLVGFCDVGHNAVVNNCKASH